MLTLIDANWLQSYVTCCTGRVQLRSVYAVKRVSQQKVQRRVLSPICAATSPSSGGDYTTELADAEKRWEDQVGACVATSAFSQVFKLSSGRQGLQTGCVWCERAQLVCADSGRPCQECQCLSCWGAETGT